MKGLCFNFYSKYNKGHKCGEKKLFYIECKEEEQKAQDPMQGNKLEVITPTISYHTFVEISTPQNLKIKGYINNKRVTMFIDSGSTHNFIPYKEAKNINCFVYPAP